MSWINQLSPEDPEYYAELFWKIPQLENRRLLSDEPLCPDVLVTRDIDPPLARRLQTLLDAVADISLCERGNVSATMASVKDDKGTLETRSYIVFNHEDDEAARHCRQHMHDVFNMLRQVRYYPPAMDGSPNVIANELEDDFIEICRAIHNYSFDVFAYRVTFRTFGATLRWIGHTSLPSNVSRCWRSLSMWTVLSRSSPTRRPRNNFPPSI